MQNNASDITTAYLRALGRRIRDWRQQQGLTLKQLAEQSGLSQRFLVQVERGAGNISVGNLLRVARALGVPLVALCSEPQEAASARQLYLEFLRLVNGYTVPQVRRALTMLQETLRTCTVHIALLGMRGAGKSTIGVRLARALRRPYYEMDRLIEAQEGLSLAEIFALHGEAYYRACEVRLLRDLLEQPPGVLVTGGGIVGNTEAFALLRRRCLLVWLQASPEVLVQRVRAQGDFRPFAHTPDALPALQALLRQREPRYQQAQIRLDTSQQSVEETLQALLSAVHVAPAPQGAIPS